MLLRRRVQCSDLVKRINSSASNRGSPDTINALVSCSPSPPNPSITSGTLQGLKVAVKDNICTAAFPTTCASKMLDSFRSPFDATVVSLLSTNGAEIIGKTNCDEFGMGSLNLYSAHGPVINPLGLQGPASEHQRRSAGGSSGGSAAAVAAHLCDAALGTDTGGSVRLPASYCGIVGLKPSYGIVSRWGVVSFADSLDCVGTLARSVTNVRHVHNTLAVYDSRDPTAAPPHIRARAKTLCAPHVEHITEDSLNGLRIGVPQEYFPAELHSSVIRPIRRVLERLKDRGASIVPVSLPSTPYGLSAYYVISSAEASSNMARYDGVQYGTRVEPPPGADLTKTANVYAYTRSQAFGQEVKRRILLGTYALSADAFQNYFLQAQRVRKLIMADFDRVFLIPNPLTSPLTPSTNSLDGVHVLLHPSAIQTAPALPDDDGVREGSSALDAYVQDVMTVPASLAGLPALSVPAGKGADGWPIGLSVVGQWGSDDLVLKVGEAVERVCEHGI